MTQVSNDENKDARFRVDKFAVPADAFDAFVVQVKHLQHTLRSLPGCENTCVLTQVAGPVQCSDVGRMERPSIGGPCH